MNNILNARVKRLIKDDLLDYGKHLIGFLGFIIIIVIINIVLNRVNIFLNRVPTPFEVATINLGNFGEFSIGNIEFIFIFISFGFSAIIMFIAGITTGSELPQHVRVGIARIEYFFATTVVAVIVSFLLAPFMLILNMIFNLLFTSESLFSNAFQLGGGEISTLITQFLIFIVLFLLGFFLSVIWQKVGWEIGILTSICLGILGFIGWYTENWFNIFIMTIENSWSESAWSLLNHFHAIVAVVMIVILGMGTYILIRDVSVKIK